MGYWTAMGEIILPQAFRNMVLTADADYHPVSGHLAGLRDLRDRFLRRRIQGRPA
jgi:hypothetical protein